MSKACIAATEAFSAAPDPDLAVTAAVSVLEDSPICNAGLGSNLNAAGRVECDASLMSGDGAFGAVAAAPGVRNPIKAAAALAAQSRLPLSMGRVRPMLIAGGAVREWALRNGVDAAGTAQDAEQWLVMPAARARWLQYTAMLHGADREAGPDAAAAAPAAADGASPGRPAYPAPPPPRSPRSANTGGQQSAEGHSPRPGEEASACMGPGEPCGGGKQPKLGPGGRLTMGRPGALEPTGSAGTGPGLAEAAKDAVDAGARLLDTVGAICICSRGRAAAGVSSGGLAMKLPGRVGEAAIFGAGCWGDDARSSGPPARMAVACSVTGVGEAVARAGLARAAAQSAAEATDAPLAEVCAAALAGASAAWPTALPVPPRDCGVLAARAALRPRPCLAAGSGCGSSPKADTALLGGPSRLGDAPRDDGVEQRSTVGGATLDQDALCFIEEADASGQGDAGCAVEWEWAVELGVAFQAASMGVAYFATGMPAPACFMLRAGSAGEHTLGSGVLGWKCVLK